MTDGDIGGVSSDSLKGTSTVRYMNQVTRQGTEAVKDLGKVCVFTWHTGLRILYTQPSLLNVFFLIQCPTCPLRTSWSSLLGMAEV